MGFFEKIRKTKLAKHLGMTYEQYIRYEESYSDKYTPEQFLLFLRAEELGMEIEQYLEYEANYKSQYTPERYLDLCKAKNLHLTLEQYDEYRSNYSTLSVDRYLQIYAARQLDLTMEEYDAYTEKYQKLYTPERFHQFFIADQHGLTLEEYDEWKSDFKSTMTIDRFKDYCAAKALGMTLDEYDEYMAAQAMGKTVEQYRKYRHAQQLGLTEQEYSIYEEMASKKEAGEDTGFISDFAEFKAAEHAGFRKVVLSVKIKEIPQHGFSNFTEAEEIILPWGITKIGEYAFSGCSNLRKMVIPGSVKEVPKGIFDGCAKLETIELLYGIEKVDITGWVDLPALRSVVSAGSIKDFVLDYNKNDGYYLCENSYNACQTMNSKKNELKVIECTGTRYDCRYATSSHGPSIFLTDYPVLETLIISSTALYTLSLKNCPNLKTIIIDGCDDSSTEFYKNGNIKKINHGSMSLYLHDDIQLPNLRFVIIKSNLSRAYLDANIPRLSWLHTPVGTERISAPSSLTAVCTDEACTIPKHIQYWVHNKPENSDYEIPFIIRNCKKDNDFIDLLTYSKPKGQYDAIELLEGETVVGTQQFIDSPAKKIRFPYSMRKIEESAFQNCKKLEIIQLSSPTVKVAPSAFSGCLNIKKIEGMDPVSARIQFNLPSLDISHVTEVDFSLFKNTIPEKSLEGSHITEVTIPAKIKHIQKRAFANSKRLKRVVFKGCPEEIAPDAFEGCTAVEEIQWGKCRHYFIAGQTGFPLIDHIPDLDEMTEIPADGFSGWGFKEIVIPESVKRIERKAFANLPNLSKIVFDGCPEKVAPDAFEGCTIVENIEWGSCQHYFMAGQTGFPFIDRIPDLDGMTEIPENGFSCWGLKEIVIPKSVKHIDHRAFANCTELAKINHGATNVFTVTNDFTFEKDSFSGCHSFHTVVFDCDSIEKKLSIVSQCSAIHVVVRDTICQRDFNAVLGLNGIQSITTIKSETSVNNNSFHLSGICPRSIQVLQLPKYIATLSENFFSESKNLRELFLGENLLFIPDKLFYGCSKLKKMTMRADLRAVTLDEKFSEDVKIAVYGELHPENYEITVSGITADLAKISQSKRALIRKITVSEMCTSISEGAFADCVNLQEVEILGKIVKIGCSAFENCMSLKMISLPDTVTSIGARAFAGCRNLTTFRVPSRLENLSEEIFDGCQSLETVSNMQRVGYVRKGAFQNCTKLRELIFSNEIFTIEDAVEGCVSLNKIVIPVDIAVFKVNLSSCSSLRTVYLPKTIDDFSCQTQPNNQLNVYAKRGSTWKADISANKITYLKLADYDSLISSELSLAGLQSAEEISSPVEKVQIHESTAKKVTRTASTSHKRASWATKSSQVEEPVLPKGPANVEALIESFTGHAESTAFSVEKATRSPSSASINLQETINPCMTDTDTSRTITNNIFTVNYTCCFEKLETVYVVLVDISGTSASTMKQIIITDPAKCSSIEVTLELISGIPNGMFYLVAATDNPIEESVISCEPYTVDIAFSLDSDFLF